MEFQIDYERHVIKNRNLFYFNYYCHNYTEFEEWLEHNNICMAEFEDLIPDLQKIYIQKIEKHIIDTFKTFKVDIMYIDEQEKIKRFKILYDIWLRYSYLMNQWMNHNNDIIMIRNWFINNQYQLMKRIATQ